MFGGFFEYVSVLVVSGAVYEDVSSGFKRLVVAGTGGWIRG